MPQRRDHLDALAIALLVACCLFWGFQQVLVKATLPEVPPVLQAAIRFMGATAILWMWCHQRGVALFERDGTLRAGLLAGVLFCGEFVCIYVGLQHTTASRLTLFLYTSPFWVAVLLPVFVPTERLRSVQWLGLGLAFAAVAFALQDGLHAGGNGAIGLGDGLALASGALWALTTLVIRTTRLASLSPEKLLYYQVAMSAVLLPFVSVELGEVWQFNLSAWAWGSLAIQTVAGAFASYLVWMWLLRHYPATRLGSFVFLTPVFAMVFGALWLGEVVSTHTLAALVAVAAGADLEEAACANTCSTASDELAFMA
jgi:drug/metabolite transporter (DMT)-like permease